MIFVNPNFSYTNLEGADLRSIYFPTRTNYVNLRNANLSGADLWPARFIGCDLSGANLNSTHLEATKFIGCDLRGANVENVLSDHILEFIEVNLQDAKLTKFDSESYYNVIWQDGIFRKGWS